jgi:hypothetical protein
MFFVLSAINIFVFLSFFLLRYHFQVHGVGEVGRSGGAAEPSSSTLLGNTLVRPLPMLALVVYVVFALLVLLKGGATMLEVTEWDLVLVILSGAPRI